MRCCGFDADTEGIGQLDLKLTDLSDSPDVDTKKTIHVRFGYKLLKRLCLKDLAVSLVGL